MCCQLTITELIIILSCLVSLMAQLRKSVLVFMQLTILFVCAVLNLADAQGLKVGYYEKTCPSVEKIVKQATAKFMSRAPTLAAPLLRMHFHDCFVRVCLAFL